MSAKKVLIASVIFFGLFMGASTFQAGFYEGQEIDKPEKLPLDKEYEELQNRIDSIRQGVDQVDSPTEQSILDSAVAGLYLVPNFVGAELEDQFASSLTAELKGIEADEDFEEEEFVGTGFDIRPLL